jgi:hypothetical protein
MLGLILLAGSLLVSVILFSLGIPFFFMFLFIPLIPFLGPERAAKRCPVCGWETNSPRIQFCPYDGTALSSPGGDGKGND